MKIGKTYDGEDFDVDLKRLVSERTFISSVTRYGKSYTLRKFCELLFGKVGIVILDPEGEFASLREKYPFLIVGKDIPLEVETAEFIAEMVLKENLSVILDFSETDIIDTQNFASLFVEKFMEIETKAKKSYLFIIEEADEFCLSSDTEILTKNGWKRYNKIKKGELVLTLNTNKDASEWKPIQKIIIKHHNGKLINLKNKSTNILITPDHRILCQNSNRNTHRGEEYYYKDYEYKQANNLTSQFRIPCARKINGKKSKYSKDLIKLIAWIITEGNTYSKKKSADKRGYIAITQSYSKNPKNCKEIKKLLNGLDYKYCLNKRKRIVKLPSGVINKGIEWDFYLNKEASHKLFKIMNNKLHSIPKEFFSLSPEELTIFFNTLIKGDGTNKNYLTRVSRKRKTQKHSAFYCGDNLELANQFQYLTQLLGLRSVLSKINNQWRVSISKNPDSHFKKMNIQEVEYKGVVWDIRTENGNFVARRHGKPFITGNCPEKGTFKSNSLRSIINLCKKGGKRGIGVVLASQRPAFVSKFALSQCTNKIVGRTEWTGDLKVIKDYLRITNDVVDKLPKLDPGEFYFSGNFVSSPQFVRIDEAETTHLGETPDILPQTPKEIQAIVSNLKAQLPKIVEEKLKPTIVDTKAVESKVKKEIGKEYDKKIKTLEKEIKILKVTEISDEEIEKKVNDKIDEYKGKYQEQEIKIKNLERFISSVVSKGQQLVEENEETTTGSEPIHIAKSKELWLQKLGGCPKKVYEELLKHPYGTLFTRVQLGIMTGYSYKSGNFNNAIGKLNTLGLIKKEGDKIGLK